MYTMCWSIEHIVQP